MASSNDTKPIQTNNLAVTPQPMTAALIFRRQLVRHPPLYLQQALSASKLPLEKFHRLLNLVFLGNFLKFDSRSSFVFFGDFYRVSLDPVILCGACGTPITRPGGGAKLSCSPGPRFPIAKFWCWIHCLQRCLHCLTTSYTDFPA